MHYFFYISLMLFCSILFSALLGNSGIVFPFPAAVIFYLAVVYGWQLGVIAAVVSGVAIELLYGYSAYSPVILLLIVGFARLWLHNYNTRNIRFTLFPGIVVGVIVFLPQLIFLQLSYRILSLMTTQLVFGVIFMMLILPLTVFTLDKIAYAVGLPLFKDAKTKLIHRKR